MLYVNWYSKGQSLINFTISCVCLCWRAIYLCIILYFVHGRWVCLCKYWWHVNLLPICSKSFKCTLFMIKWMNEVTYNMDLDVKWHVDSVDLRTIPSKCGKKSTLFNIIMVGWCFFLELSFATCFDWVCRGSTILFSMFMYHVLTNIIPQQHSVDKELMFL